MQVNDFKAIKNMSCLEKNLAYIRSEYKKFRDMEMPELTEELFNYFYATGQRQEYEQKYFVRRGALLMSAMMCFIYGEDEHFETLLRIINDICAEKTWAFPAHMSEGTLHPERVIDLFSAETGHALTEICEFLGSKLPVDIIEKIRVEVETRIINPFIEEIFPWETFNHNWAAVCGGAVGMTFLYAFPEKFNLVEKRINGALKSYLSGFGDDGISTEGLGYWNYGFWYFTGFADLYKERCGVDLMNNSKVKNIAMCQQNMFLTDNSVISYGDCVRHKQYHSGLAHYLRNRYGSDIRIINDKISSGVDHCYRFLSCTRTFMWTDKNLAGLKEAKPSESYFKDAEWYINRKAKFAFTAKSGSNGGNHNHNDVGSFIIAGEEGQLIADFGSGEYTHEYFNEGRYDYLCNSSRGHNVPIIDGKYQSAGQSFKGKVIWNGAGVFELDMAEAYAGVIKRLKRKFNLNDNYIELTDVFEFNDDSKHDITERFVSVIKPKITDGKVAIGSMVIECDETPILGSEHLQNHAAEDDVLYFVDYKSNTTFKIKFIMQ